jgi:Holliday junction resolvasome RuvABC endonuclease subunit
MSKILSMTRTLLSSLGGKRKPSESSPSRLICLDIGTNMGFVLAVGTEGESGVKVFPKSTNTCYNELFGWLQTHVGSTDTVVVEKPHAGQFFNATRKLFGMLAVIELYCEQTGCPFHVVSPTSIKKAWTGSGRASKADMKKAAIARGLAVKNNNEIDAIALWYYWMEAV